MIVRALLVCSDEGCTAEYEAFGPVEEIEALACDCGLGLEALGWPERAYEWEEADGRIVLLPLGSSPE